MSSIISKNGLINKTNLLELFFEQNPNASIKEAESMLMVNGLVVHKTLIQKIKKNAGKRKSPTVAAKKNQPAGTLTEKIREIVREEIAETIKSELAKLLS